MSHDKHKNITIRYDSKLAANLALGNWKPKANAELVENVTNLRKNVELKGHKIKMEHVKSHIGIKNNERADKNATKGAVGCNKMWVTVKQKKQEPGWQELELHKSEKIKKLSEQYEERRKSMIAEVLRSNQKPYNKEDDPIRNFLVRGTLELSNFAGKHRDGNPRHNWWTVGLKN